ncbi:MAG TPA: hypothetical protein VM166_07380 [Gemmatimonadaceae bacterium]|nr:hypothetical protein [Gemmatimonadaceae bacterium]
MKATAREQVVVEQALDGNTQAEFVELSELQLALVGGGGGDVVFH